MTPTLSVCIPTYEMNGLGVPYLRQSFDVLRQQSFQDFEIIISDHSHDGAVKSLCSEYEQSLKIHYIHNPHQVGSSSANLNQAVKRASGKLIKILFQDDFLYHPNALRDIVRHFDLKTDRWLVTACIHTIDGIHFDRPFHPTYNDKIVLGNNTISSPSVLTILNDHPLLFDEQLLWLMDCDYYQRCYEKFGEPKILDVINVVNRTGAHQISNTLANKKTRYWENIYIRKKYRLPVSLLENVKYQLLTLS